MPKHERFGWRAKLARSAGGPYGPGINIVSDAPVGGQPEPGGLPSRKPMTRRFEFPHGVTVFSPTIEFRAVGKPAGTFNLETRTWEALGNPREIDVTVEAVVA